MLNLNRLWILTRFLNLCDNPNLDNPEPVNLEFDNPEQEQAQPDMRNFAPNPEIMQQQQIQQQNQQMPLLIEATLNSN